MDKVQKRQMCERCERPKSACICHLVTQVAAETELLILQHPLEAGHAKGSARLLQLSISGSRLVRGERLEQLEALLYEGDRTPVLLFPDTELVSAQLYDASAVSTKLRLVVLDGTWRKCRKMLYLNPALQQLPRLPLVAPPPSRYRIRKAHAPDQLSTLEATCHALAQLENAPDRYQDVLTAFDQLVAAHESLESRGREA